jgi:hypothetical protein
MFHHPSFYLGIYKGKDKKMISRENRGYAEVGQFWTPINKHILQAGSFGVKRVKKMKKVVLP